MHFVVLVIWGIIFQFYTKIWSFGFLPIFYVILFLLSLLFIFKNKVVRTILAFFLFFFIGIVSVYVNNDQNNKDYYHHFVEQNSKVIFTVKRVLKSGFYHHKYQVEVTQVNGLKTRGEVLLNINKDSLFIPLKVDEQIYLKAVFQEIKLPLNPHQFNYKEYLEKQGIYQQVYLNNSKFIKLKTSIFSLVGLSSKFRNKIQESLQKHHFKPDELAVINALLLGQRQDISKELISDYQRAGAIHILAVSGLHVGVFLLILSFLFKPIERIKYGKFIKVSLIVLLLWVFAFIAGLSASVVRAVTMFTFLALGMTFRRKNRIEFSLITSMFLLLIIKPMFLFDVGFQLSYLAVFGIIWIQPKLDAIYKPRFLVDKKVWQLFTVSIAAQLGVLPLSIFYFQQFPGLFLASNLIIIPCLMYILVGGIISIFLSLFNILPQFLADVYGKVISWMNSFVSWISNQEAFLFKEISISFLMMISWYVLIVFGTRFFINKKPKKLLFFLTSILILQSIFFIEFRQKNDKNEFIIFHKSRHSIIGKRVGEQLFLQHDLDSLNFKDDYSLKSFRIKENIKVIHQIDYKNIIQFSNKNILLIDSLSVYNIKGLGNPIVVLQQSPRINLSGLIKKIKPSQIIADGSNYKSYVKRWKLISEKEKIPFYNTSKSGAFIIKK